jgi:hypothetical protein
MRWLVEVSSIGKTDTQKFCVEAESWQRALQGARTQRGEEGPMSGFSIELLEEGYRAVDPLARVRFVVKRAPDDMPVTVVAGKGSLPPSARIASVPPAAPGSSPPSVSSSAAPKAPASAASSTNDLTTPNLPPTPSSSSPSKTPPRPGQSAPPPAGSGAAHLTAHLNSSSTRPEGGKAKSQTMTFASEGAASVSEPPVADRAAPPAVGSAIPGLPSTKLLTSREQDPHEGSPLTYREYAFAVAEGTTEEVAAEILRAQLHYVEAHIATAKTGKLVNLAVFDVEFTGKPPRPPVATLTWKDWKGEPIVGFPRRTGSQSAPPRPPSKAPPSLLASATASGAAVSIPQPAAIPQIVHAPVEPVLQTAPMPVVAPSAPPQAAPMPSAPVPASAFPAPAVPHRSPSSDGPIPQAVGYVSQPPQPIAPPPAPMPTFTDTAGTNMVKTASGRYVRGRVVGDELITSLFESMHDLHFLRDALDGGQFCLALATEVLPSRAAIIHFFDLEKREWVVACTRGKEMQRLLAMRAPEGDELLRECARKRRALVVPDASQATSERYRQLNGARSLIAAPIMQAGRALGALEIINPLDGMPFTEDEGNAMTYIAEQYAEYLGSRGIVLDRERIHSAAAR